MVILVAEWKDLGQSGCLPTYQTCVVEAFKKGCTGEGGLGSAICH